MFSLSETRPKLRDVIIPRDSDLDHIDSQFHEDKVLCVTGTEGVGITTTLALFAKRHSTNCASYFNNGWSRHLLMPESIVSSLLEQLSLYCKTDILRDIRNYDFSAFIYKLNRFAKSKKEYLYFVFDGFDKIPTEYFDTIKNLLSQLFKIENGRFLFSGNHDAIKQLVPENVHTSTSNKILRFNFNDVKEYFNSIQQDLAQEEIQLIFDLSDRALARKLFILSDKLQQYGIGKLHDYDFNEVDDFFEEDFNWLEEQNNRLLIIFMSLLVFSERPLNAEIIGHNSIIYRKY